MRQREGRALRQFTFSTRKSAGRNSGGLLTVFHRGGGSKRLQRRIDLKRSTSSMGIVERIEYDPNRSSRIALVRWSGVHQKIEEFAPPTTIPPFSFPDQRKDWDCFSPGLMAYVVVVGLPTRTSWSKSFTTRGSSTSTGRGKKTSKDVFFSLSSPASKGETASLSFSSFGFPRIAVAGAKPAFFAPRMKVIRKKCSLCEIRKRNILWWAAHRIKRRAALSWWQSSRTTLGRVGAEHNDQGGSPEFVERRTDRAPVV